MRTSLGPSREGSKKISIAAFVTVDTPPSPSYPFPRMPPSTPPPTLRSSPLLDPIKGRQAAILRPQLVSAFSTWSSSPSAPHADSPSVSSSSNVSYRTWIVATAPALDWAAPRRRSRRVGPSPGPSSPTLRPVAGGQAVVPSQTTVLPSLCDGSSSRSPSPTLIGESAQFSPEFCGGVPLDDSPAILYPYDDLMSSWENVVETVDPTDTWPATLGTFEEHDSCPWSSSSMSSDQTLSPAWLLAPSLRPSSSLSPKDGYLDALAGEAPAADGGQPVHQTFDDFATLGVASGPLTLRDTASIAVTSTSTGEQGTRVHVRTRVPPPEEAWLDFTGASMAHVSGATPRVPEAPASLQFPSPYSHPPESLHAFAFMLTDPFPHSPRCSPAVFDASPPPSPPRSMHGSTTASSPFKRLRRRVSHFSGRRTPPDSDTTSHSPTWLGKLTPRLPRRRLRSSSPAPSQRRALAARSTPNLRNRARAQALASSRGAADESASASSESHRSGSSAGPLVPREPYARETVLLLSKQERYAGQAQAHGHRYSECACCASRLHNETQHVQAAFEEGLAPSRGR
ncbi:hypothetical protein JCM3770_001685 [Rhodotorula araucariae]